MTILLNIFRVNIIIIKNNFIFKTQIIFLLVSVLPPIILITPSKENQSFSPHPPPNPTHPTHSLFIYFFPFHFFFFSLNKIKPNPYSIFFSFNFSLLLSVCEKNNENGGFGPNCMFHGGWWPSQLLFGRWNCWRRWWKINYY